MPNHKTTWIVTANSAQAKIFRLTQFPKIEEVDSLEHPESRLHDRDLTTSKPGRSFDKGGTTRHAYEAETDPKSTEVEKFAVQLHCYLLEALQKGEFSRLYIMASPEFLGVLRKHLNPKIQSTIIAEAAKDIVKHSKADIEQHLSELQV